MTSTQYHDRPIPWVSETLIDFNGIQVELCVPPALYDRQSMDKHFILGKSRPMIDAMMNQTQTVDVRRIIDVGVYKGGSVVFLNEVFHPEKLVAIERNPARASPLTHYCDDPARADRLRVFHEVDQADQAALGRICRYEFDDQPLDLVVDDASHFFEETRSTFCALFPRLRPGGIYIIEDWGWAHWPGDYWQKERGGDYFRSKLPLSNLLVELMLLCASSPDLMLLGAGSPELVSKVTCNSVVTYIERGPGMIDPGFQLSDYLFNRGDPIPRIGGGARAGAIFASPTFVIRG